ncbi:MAG: L-2-hydroxyglutarate oxidase [Bacteroidetes bacterium]|nr:MAG: L-2-hydroxyglutarate oxidase [Bacteroidota bacterium]
MEQDILIIGGGIVGLATALNILQTNPALKVCILEKESDIAQHQTGNNSGVIHSGIYYKPNSLKAQNCIRGYEMLVDFCKKNEIAFDLCGKIIVATQKNELPMLDNIFERGVQNGLQNLRKIPAEQIKEFEPYVNGIAAIHVPQTGIVDYKAVSQKYRQLIEQLGGEVRTNEKVIEIKAFPKNSEVITEKRTFLAKLLINCAGLYSDKVAEMTQKDVNFKIIPFRGEYYELKKEKQYLVKNLIYPVPDPNFPFLGVHFTRMIGGGIEAGPNAVLAFKREGYKRTDFDWEEFSEIMAWRGFQKVALKYWQTGLGEFYRSFSKSAFTEALQRLVPDIEQDDLVEGGAGIRAQACDKTGGLLDDFMILEDKLAIHVGNAPSPAATSSLSIGKTVAEMALKRQ